MDGLKYSLGLDGSNHFNSSNLFMYLPGSDCCNVKHLKVCAKQDFSLSDMQQELAQHLANEVYSL